MTCHCAKHAYNSILVKINKCSFTCRHRLPYIGICIVYTSIYTAMRMCADECLCVVSVCVCVDESLVQSYIIIICDGIMIIILANYLFQCLVRSFNSRVNISHHAHYITHSHLNDMRWRHDDDGVHFLYDMYYVSYIRLLHTLQGL